MDLRLTSETPANQRFELGVGCSLSGECGPFIRCLDCNRTSYHPQDVAERYCSRCKKFHEREAA